MSIYYFDTLPSTNLYLKDNSEKLNNLDGAVARHQTSGRGRMGRTWVDQDDLLMSILIKEKIDAPERLSLLICHTIFKVLSRYLDNVKIKWPNDILVNEKKICGILLEGKSDNKDNIIVIGFGINVNSTSFPSDLRVTPTSMKLEIKREFSVKDLSKEVYDEFVKDFTSFKNNDTSFLDTCKRESMLINKDIYYIENGVSIKAKVVNILDNGNILLDKDGEMIEKRSGEISLHESYQMR